MEHFNESTVTIKGSKYLVPTSVIVWCADQKKKEVPLSLITYHMLPIAPKEVQEWINSNPFNFELFRKMFSMDFDSKEISKRWVQSHHN
ncbi:hypothetical protein ATZ33_11800 [Enterococcus silesiacus]|uniref:Uncharacterized protein n=1 Tax=Enterococcus silesiacus TaxID=332949 RepID=A0A0S3KCK9_9ENTE|nr:hypothetical protein [Enterococcus silesiacus]ALS02043.1 hypothetical protein ATZ33_11800 [Enterococcus silesiacus]OJG88956.1 hypothetical protein RV15_GL001692 [Enterococcus silesiacus]